MKIGNIIAPNEKGQIVIPKEMREAMGLTPHSYLQLVSVGKSIIINPITDVVTSQDSDFVYKNILQKTAGAWAGDNYPVTRKKRRKIELEANLKNIKAW